MTPDLVEIEEQGWKALTSEGNAGKKFYQSILHPDAVMLFPGGLRIERKANILASIGDQPWHSYQIKNVKIVELSKKAGVLVYDVTAQSEDLEPYRALISSIYVMENGAWWLILHQQTPK